MKDYHEDEKVYRIFISSCSALLKKEREYLKEEILKAGHLPIAMEYNFTSKDNNAVIVEDMKKLNQADCVIFILSHIYGSIIGKKIGDKCKLKKKYECCGSCDGHTCKLSFTHFEYLYSKENNKLMYIIWNENFDKEDDFKKNNKGKGNEKNTNNYKNHKEMNDKFIHDIIDMQYATPYNNNTQKNKFKEKCHDVLLSAIITLHMMHARGIDSELGLIPVRYIKEYTNKDAIYFFDRNHRPEESDIKKNLNQAKKIYFMARAGNTFFEGNDRIIKNAIERGCECRFIILKETPNLDKHTLSRLNTSMSYLEEYKALGQNKKNVSVKLINDLPAIDIVYMEKENGEDFLLMQMHALVAQGAYRPMFMLDVNHTWYDTFINEINTVWDNYDEWKGERLGKRYENNN